MASVTPADAEKVLYQKLSLKGDTAKKLIATVTGSDGKVPKKSLDKLVSGTSKAIRDMTGEFKALDTDKSGTVTHEQADTIMAKHFPGMPASVRKAVINRCDKEGYKKVDFLELEEFWIVLYAKREFMEERFNQLDADKNGTLDKDELAESLMTELVCDRLTADMMVDSYDTNKDGKIDREEFQKMWTKIFG